jgi:hypothetical protein
MTEDQFKTVVMNMHQQSVYQQQTIGHLIGLLHGLKEVVVRVGKNSGLSVSEMEGLFASTAKRMNNALAEIPFPEFQFPGDFPAGENSPQSPPPHEP